MKRKSKLYAFTLVEVIVSFVIVSIILIVLGSFFSYNLSLFSRGQDRTRIQHDLRMASDYISSELRVVNKIGIEQLSQDNSKLDLVILNEKFPMITEVEFSITKLNNNWMVTYYLIGKSNRWSNYYDIEATIVLLGVEEGNVGTDTKVYYIK